MTTNIKSQLTDLIVDRLNETKEHLKQQFFLEYPIKAANYLTLDNLLLKMLRKGSNKCYLL
jgi:hypothetical protein